MIMPAFPAAGGASRVRLDRRQPGLWRVDRKAGELCYRLRGQRPWNASERRQRVEDEWLDRCER